MSQGAFASYPSLRGRVVFISGGSSGIGAELVRAFAAQGSVVAFCGTKPEGGEALIATHVARPTLFLASDDSEGMTGQNIIVDAGLAQVSVAG